MFLYHGTNEKAARLALKDGLKPRKLTGKSNWKHSLESRSDTVYLTSAYAPYFALQATDEDEKWGIVEIDVDLLDEKRLRPDEDAVEQTTRGIKDFGPIEDPQVRSILAKMPLTDMRARTEYVRANLDRLHNLWRASLKWLGNCSYKGTVPAKAISRVSIFDPKSNPYVVLTASDPTITVANFKMLADRYEALTRWFFDPITADELLGEIDRMSLTVLPPDQAKARREYVERMVAQRQGVKALLMAGTLKDR